MELEFLWVVELELELELKITEVVLELNCKNVIDPNPDFYTLNWKAHISYISGKISKAIGVMIKARNLGKEALLSLYYTLIFTYLTYCNQVWGSTFKYNLKILSKLKKTIRIICSEKPYSHTEGLYRELGLLKVTEIYRFLVGQFMFIYHHKMLPNFFLCIFYKT